MQRHLPYHRRIDDSLDVILTRLAAEPEGFSTPLLQTNAWELANRTGAINHIELALVSELSAIYNRQAYYQRKLDENWYVAGNVNPTNFAATALATGILVNDIVHQEEALVEHYPALLERLNERLP